MDFDEAEGGLVSKAEEIVLEDEKETSERNVSRLRDEILRNGLAVYGLKETGKAVMNGQMELLLQQAQTLSILLKEMMLLI